MPVSRQVNPPILFAKDSCPTRRNNGESGIVDLLLMHINKREQQRRSRIVDVGLRSEARRWEIHGWRIIVPVDRLAQSVTARLAYRELGAIDPFHLRFICRAMVDGRPVIVWEEQTAFNMR